MKGGVLWGCGGGEREEWLGVGCMDGWVLGGRFGGLYNINFGSEGLM